MSRAATELLGVPNQLTEQYQPVAFGRNFLILERASA